MIFDHLTVEFLRIPLHLRFAQSNQNTRYSDSLLVRVHTADGTTGYGECCPRSYVTGETAESTAIQLRTIGEALHGTKWTDFDQLLAWLKEPLPGMEPAAICGLEMALLDAWGKSHQISLAQTFNAAIPPRLKYSGIIPMSSSTSLEPILSRFDFPAIKVKMGSDLAWNLNRLRWIRRMMGNEIDIRVDLNGGWTLAQARLQIPALLKAGITWFEQPLHPEHDADMSLLMAEFGWQATFVADESLTTVESALSILKQKIFTGFNVKLSKHGGLLRSLTIYQLATQHGIPCQLGAHFGETSLLTAAGLIFSGLAPKLKYREGALGTLILARDVCLDSLHIDAQGCLNDGGQRLAGNGWGIDVAVDKVVT